MRRIVVTEFISLDGFMQDPGGSDKTERGGWAFKIQRGPEGDRFKLDELFASDAMLLGRVTYQGFAAAWPAMTNEFADKMNGMPKYVVSTSLEHGTWNNTSVIRANVVEEITRLKTLPGQDILVAGSGRLIQTLMRHDLVDEYRLMVYPLILGKGQRLFEEEGQLRALRLVEAKAVGSEGVLTLIYQPDRKP